MSTELLERPDTTPVVETKDEPKITHIVCHCGNLEIAWCYARDLEDGLAGPDEAMNCPMCLIVWEGITEDNPTCPWGCGCSPKESEFPCGLWYEDDDEEDSND